MKKLVPFLFTIFFCIGAAHAVDYPFSLTTVEMSANSVFNFMLSAQGTFYVDCGTGGTLSGTGVNGGTITKNDVTNYTYTCAYSSSGTKTIRFGGVATGYNTGVSVAAISFYPVSGHLFISSISGNISAIFPYLGSHANGQAPKFYETFRNISVSYIPDTLFSNYRGDLSGSLNMFYWTFAWSSLRAIPESLFSGITAVGEGMFTLMFRGTLITSIPENLFANITNSAPNMFFYTFSYCMGLTSLPKRLFANITTPASGMFMQTFEDCQNLNGYVPPTLFAGLIANNSPYATNMMTNIFGIGNTNSGTNLDTTCPAGTTQYRTGYEQYWGTGNGTAVSCEPNTLNVNWYNGNSQLTVGSESQTCEYGDTITVPTINATKNGYHFNGWKIKTNQ